MADKEDQFVDYLKINAAKGPLQPVQLGPDSEFAFRCHKQVKCFNACCKSIDIILTPYDIVRLKQRLKVSSDDFLMKYAVPFEMDYHGMPGFKMRTKENSPQCQFMTDAGCDVYEDRPVACRYYPVGSMGMRKKDSSQVDDVYFLVKEDHCLGHEEERKITIGEYRREQGVEDYDKHNAPWRDIVIKKRSAGPTVGKPSERSFQLFQMCSYEMDHFREFINSTSFRDTIDLDEDAYEKLNNDEVALLDFAMRFLKQVLFGESSIPYKEDASEKRKQKAQERLNERRSKQIDEDRLNDDRYDNME